MTALVGGLTVASTILGVLLGQITAGREVVGVVLGALVLMSVRA